MRTLKTSMQQGLAQEVPSPPHPPRGLEPLPPRSLIRRRQHHLAPSTLRQHLGHSSPQPALGRPPLPSSELKALQPLAATQAAALADSVHSLSRAPALRRPLGLLARPLLLASHSWAPLLSTLATRLHPPSRLALRPASLPVPRRGSGSSRRAHKGGSGSRPISLGSHSSSSRPHPSRGSAAHSSRPVRLSASRQRRGLAALSASLGSPQVRPRRAASLGPSSSRPPASSGLSSPSSSSNWCQPSHWVSPVLIMPPKCSHAQSYRRGCACFRTHAIVMLDLFSYVMASH